MWKDAEKVILPPQTRVHAFSPIDLRINRWELFQDVRHIPLMSDGKIQHTIVLPWHVTMDNAKLRSDERAPKHQHWLLTAASPQKWILHQLILPEDVHLDLFELERLNLQEGRGGMRLGKVPLRVLVAHLSETQNWKVDADMNVAYMLDTMAIEYETEANNILLMRVAHFPGLHEVITSYLPEVQVYVIDRMHTYESMTQHNMRAGVM